MLIRVCVLQQRQGISTGLASSVSLLGVCVAILLKLRVAILLKLCELAQPVEMPCPCCLP